MLFILIALKIIIELLLFNSFIVIIYIGFILNLNMIRSAFI